MNVNGPIPCQIGGEHSGGQIARVFLLVAKAVDILHAMQTPPPMMAPAVGVLGPFAEPLLKGLQRETNPFFESFLQKQEFGQEALEKIAAEIYLALTGKPVSKEPEPKKKRKK